MRARRAEWKAYKLDELGFVGRGRSRHRPRNDPRLYGGPYPFIQTADIMAADPYITGYSQTLSEFGLAQSKLWPADTLCITIAGANTAQTAILKISACFPDSVIGFRPYPDKANLFFVKYSLDLMKGRFRAVTLGATQDNLSMDKLLSFPIPAPPIKAQQQIGSILSSFDDLIDNNSRRIKLLEEMARRIFDEWFVRFRMSKYENVPAVESSVGLIPQGWHVKRLSEIAQLVMGQSPKSEHYNSQGDGLPFHQGVTDFGSLYPEHRVYCTVEQRVAEPDDILVSVRAPVGRINLAADRIIIGRGLAAVRPKQGLWCFVLGALHHFFDAEDKIGNEGAIFKSVGRAELEKLPFACPPEATITEFNRTIEPIWKLIKNLTFTIRNLRAQRDLLLPKLVSGEIDVSRAKRVMEAAE